jgi:hypothetical protein
VIEGLKTQKEGAERTYGSRVWTLKALVFVGPFLVAVRSFCTLQLTVNFMFVPLVRNRFAHALHPAALAFVSYGIVLGQVQVQGKRKRLASTANETNTTLRNSSARSGRAHA